MCVSASLIFWRSVNTALENISEAYNQHNKN